MAHTGQYSTITPKSQYLIWRSSRNLMVKAIVYRVFSVLVTFLITYVISGSAVLSVGVSVFEIIAKTTMYYMFDTGWNHIQNKL